MRFEFPPEGDPIDASWWAPLVAVGETIRADRRHRFFEVEDFMFMVRLARGERPSLYLYKHIFTRRYLNLDEAVRPYRYFPPLQPNSRSHGQYRPQRSLDEAVDHLELWELPWMKAGLEHEQRGLPWDERWRLHPDEEGEGAVEEWHEWRGQSEPWAEPQPQPQPQPALRLLRGSA